MQLDPGFPQLTLRLLSGTFRNFQRLKLKHDKLLSIVASNCNLRHCIKGRDGAYRGAAKACLAALFIGSFVAGAALLTLVALFQLASACFSLTRNLISS